MAGEDINNLDDAITARTPEHHLHGMRPPEKLRGLLRFRHMSWLGSCDVDVGWRLGTGSTTDGGLWSVKKTSRTHKTHLLSLHPRFFSPQPPPLIFPFLIEPDLLAVDARSTVVITPPFSPFAIITRAPTIPLLVVIVVALKAHPEAALATTECTDTTAAYIAPKGPTAVDHPHGNEEGGRAEYGVHTWRCQLGPGSSNQAVDVDMRALTVEKLFMIRWPIDELHRR